MPHRHTTSTSTTLGQRVRAARAKKGLSQVALAEQAGISQSMLSAVEGDRTNISVSKARALADALGVSLDWLCPPLKPPKG